LRDTTLPINPERSFTWEQWQAGRVERRRLGNLVAPKVIRRKKNEGDEYLRAIYNSERGQAEKGLGWLGALILVSR